MSVIKKEAVQDDSLDLKIPPAQRRGVRPCFIDGRMSSKTYLIIASAIEGDETPYNALGIRKIGPDHYRTHAYPGFAFFGVPELRGYRKDTYGYEGAYLTKKEIENMLLRIGQKRGMRVADVAAVFPVSERGYDPYVDAV